MIKLHAFSTHLCCTCVSLQLKYGVEGYSKLLVPRDQVFSPSREGNRPGLGGPETCYIPKSHTLTVLLYRYNPIDIFNTNLTKNLSKAIPL